MHDTTPAFRSCRVLVVEDDSDDVFLLNRALTAASKSAGVSMQLTHTRNGFEALSAVARGDLTDRLPDIVVVDLNMPVMSGELFLRRLRDDLGLAQLPAVVLTTSDERPIHSAAMASGADHVFVKPSSYAELLVIANKVIEFAVDGGASIN